MNLRNYCLFLGMARCCANVSAVSNIVPNSFHSICSLQMEAVPVFSFLKDTPSLMCIITELKEKYSSYFLTYDVLFSLLNKRCPILEDVWDRFYLRKTL